jgi:hypothetical protein
MSNARPADPFNLCQFTFANGRMCGLPAHPKHDGLCLNHARAASFKNEPQEQDLSAELSSFAGDYITQIDINHVLGKLFDILAANRISRQRAACLAYIADLLMRSQEGAKQEATRWAQDLPAYRRLLSLKYPKGHPNHPDAPDPAKPEAKPKRKPRAKKAETELEVKSEEDPVPGDSSHPDDESEAEVAGPPNSPAVAGSQAPS